MSAAPPALPTFYIPHGGGPCFFMDPNRLRPDGTVDTGRGPGVDSMFTDWPHPSPDPWNDLADWLRRLPSTLERKPRAVLVISGHWEEDPVAVNVGRQPPLLFDYYGFPEHTYRLRYPAPGDAGLAGEIRELLAAAAIPCREEPQRGLDHGVFVPFLLIYPRADMPIVQLSLKRGLDAAAHLRLGAALAPLRERGVLIVGSGMSFHNLHLRSTSNTPFAGSEQFDAALGAAVCTPDPQERNHRLAQWQQLPAARFAHPREEHLLPLMVAAGAAGDEPAHRVFNGLMMGWRISGFRFGAP